MMRSAAGGTISCTALIATLGLVAVSLAGCGDEPAGPSAPTLTPLPSVTVTFTPTPTLTVTPTTTATPTNTPETRPDLIPLLVREFCAGDGAACAPLKLRVCVDNRGPGDASSSFLVSVNHRDEARVDGLLSGGEACVDVVYGFENVQPSITVDRLNEVDESNETNNVLTFPQPSGTMCDYICLNHSAKPVPTPPPPSSNALPSSRM